MALVNVLRKLLVDQLVLLDGIATSSSKGSSFSAIGHRPTFPAWILPADGRKKKLMSEMSLCISPCLKDFPAVG